MELKIHQPYGYGPGAYKIEASLSSSEMVAYAMSPISFHLPELPKRLILPPPPFVIAVSTETGPKLHGVFVDGKWESHVYSNGISEEENPTKIGQIELELRESIAMSVKIAVDAYRQNIAIHNLLLNRVTNSE